MAVRRLYTDTRVESPVTNSYQKKGGWFIGSRILGQRPLDHNSSYRGWQEKSYDNNGFSPPNKNSKVCSANRTTVLHWCFWFEPRNWNNGISHTCWCGSCETVHGLARARDFFILAPSLEVCHHGTMAFTRFLNITVARTIPRNAGLKNVWTLVLTLWLKHLIAIHTDPTCCIKFGHYSSLVQAAVPSQHHQVFERKTFRPLRQTAVDSPGSSWIFNRKSFATFCGS